MMDPVVLLGLGAMLAFWICRALACALIHSILAPLVGRERWLRTFGSPAPHNSAAHDLQHWLAEGPLPAREIKARAMKFGHGLAALSRAATDLGVFEYTDANDEIWWDAPTKSLAPTVSGT